MSAYEYIYTREIVDGLYNIDNPKTADIEGLLVHLATYVEPSFPGKPFLLRCSGTQAIFIFESALSGEDETTLTNLVTTYKALTGE